MSDAPMLRIERACADAWPAQQDHRVGDWLARVSGGPTRRINSVNPRVLSPGDPRAHLPELAALYAARDQPVIFRVPSFATDVDAALDAAGFGPPEAPTATLYADLKPRRYATDVDVRVAPFADPDWLAARGRFAGDGTPFAELLARIAVPVRFASIAVEGSIAVIAYAAIAHRLLVIEAVATDPAARRRGLARRCVSGLLDWAQGQGVGAACLQVVADNDAAIGLYTGLGFTTRLYDYHYRRAPVQPRFAAHIAV